MPKYRVIYADPPWSYYGSSTKDAAAGKHYELMDQGRLDKLPIKGLIDGHGALFLWATCPRLDFAVDMISRWGFYYRGVAWIWVKTNSRGEIIQGQGVPPTFTKPTTELLLAATTMPRGRPFPILDLGMGQVVLHRRGAHSEKPGVFRDLIVQLCGEIPRIELFARARFPGWDAWGNQVKSDVSLGTD